MELTYEMIAHDKFAEAFGLLLEKKVSVGTAVNIGRSIEVLNKETSNFRTVRDGLVKRYGIEVKDDKGETTGWTMQGVSVENIEGFNKDYLDLIQTKFEIPLNTKVTLKADDGEMTGLQAFLLKDFVEIKE